jgi:heme-degrading monooxygenase HmoA
MKKLLVQFNFPGMSAQQYEQVMNELINTGHSEIAGRIHHASTKKDNGVQVIGIWESRDAFDNFGKIVGPIFNKFGIPPVQPSISPVYYEYSGMESNAHQMKKQLVQFSFPNMTERQYDQVWNELRRAGHPTPNGLIHHVSTFQGDSCLIFDVWESKEAFDQFGKVLMPILYKLGMENTQPVVTPIINEFTSVEIKATH